MRNSGCVGTITGGTGTSGIVTVGTGIGVTAGVVSFHYTLMDWSFPGTGDGAYTIRCSKHWIATNWSWMRYLSIVEN